MAAQGQDPIERYETPHNMMGRSRLVRHAYALFGRPGAQPAFPGANARLMWPFAVRWQDFAIFYILDVRIGGFGPLFSGILLLSLLPLAAAFARPQAPRLLLALGAVTIVASLLVSVHTWWPRYGPQLWCLPILGILAGLLWAPGHPLRWTARAVTTLLLVNAVLIAFVHLRWETTMTRALGAQLRRVAEGGAARGRLPVLLRARQPAAAKRRRGVRGHLAPALRRSRRDRQRPRRLPDACARLQELAGS